jgi:predicted phosphatase
MCSYSFAVNNVRNNFYANFEFSSYKVKLATACNVIFKFIIIDFHFYKFLLIDYALAQIGFSSFEREENK